MSFNTTNNDVRLGLSNKTGGGSIIKIVSGSFRISVSEGTKDAVTRENKEGKVVHELVYSAFTGYIRDIKKEDGKYGQQVRIAFQADKNYTLSLGYADGTTSSLFKMLPNIDLSLPVELKLVSREENGKNKVSLFVSQNDKTVKWAFTKDNPNGMPPFVQIVRKGKKEWDNTEQVDWLWERAMEKLAQAGVEKADDFKDFEVQESPEF